MKIRTAVERFVEELDAGVFSIGFGVSLIAIVVFFLNPEASAEKMGAVNEYLWSEFMWVYVLSMFLMVLFSLWLMFGPWGDIKLGDPDESPEFSTPAFFAMMFSAGIAADHRTQSDDHKDRLGEQKEHHQIRPRQMPQLGNDLEKARRRQKYFDHF